MKSRCFATFAFAFAFLFVFPLEGQEPTETTFSHENLSIPNPLNLRTTWWDYFDVKGEELQSRIDLFLNHLTEFQGTLAPEQQEKVNLYIKKVYASVQALPKLSQQNFHVPLQRPFLKSYTIEQQLELASKQKNIEAVLKNETKELQLLNKRMFKIEAHIDDMMAAYLRMEKNSGERLVQGLEIISSRLILALTEEKKRLISLRADEYSKQLDRVNEEMRYGVDNANYQTLNEKTIHDEIAKLKDQLLVRQKHSIRAELNAVGTFGNTPIECATAELLSQKAVNSFTKEALTAAEVLFFEAKNSLYLLTTDSSSVPLKLLDEQIEKWKKELAELSVHQAEWKEKSAQELEHIGQKVGGANAEIAVLQSERYEEVQDTLKNVDLLDNKIYHTKMVLKLLEKEATTETSSYIFWWYRVTDYFSDCCSSAFGWLHRSVIKIGDVPITPVSIFEAFTILGMTYFFSWLVRKGMAGFSRIKKRVSESSLYTLDRVLHYIILMLGCTFALSAIGLDFSNLLIVLGALSVGIGFGLQSVVNNFVCSLIILFSRNVKVGDYIQLTSGDWGRVSDVNVQNTIIKTWDGIDVVVPNSELISGRFINWTMQDPYKRLHIPFSVPYGTDKDFIAQIITDVAMKVPGTISNHPRLDDPNVWLVNFGDWALEFELVVWVNIYGAGNHDSLVSSYKWEIDTVLRKNGIESPYHSFYKMTGGPEQHPVLTTK